jgi:hypothetical protein
MNLDTEKYYRALENRLKMMMKDNNNNNKNCLLSVNSLDKLDVIDFHKVTGNDLLFCKLLSDMIRQNFLVSKVMKDYMINECKSLDSFEYILSILSPENVEKILSKLSKNCQLIPVYFPIIIGNVELEALHKWYSRIIPTMTGKEIRESNIPIDNRELMIIADSLGVWNEM